MKSKPCKWSSAPKVSYPEISEGSLWQRDGKIVTAESVHTYSGKKPWVIYRREDNKRYVMSTDTLLRLWERAAKLLEFGKEVGR